MPGPGGRYLVPAPPRLAPPVSLLSSVDEIVPNRPGVGNPEGVRWLNGIHYRTEPCDLGDAGFVGCATTWEKDEDRTGSEVAADPFLVYVGETCSTIGWEANEYVARATRWLGAVEAWQVEREFWTGTHAKAGIAATVAYPDDQWLANASEGNTVTVLNSGTAVGTILGIALLQEALGNCAGGGRGMIHAPTRALPFVQSHGLIRRDGMRYLDGKDNVFTPGNGYPGTSAAGAAPDAGAVWVFATGMPRVYRDDVLVLPETMAGAVNRATNTVTFRAERHYLVDWDRCCHFAVHMTLN